MQNAKCPNCGALNSVSDHLVGGDIVCRSCGQTFFCESSAPSPSMPKPLRHPAPNHLSTVGGHLAPTTSTLNESFWFAIKWLLYPGILGMLLIVLGLVGDNPVVTILGYGVASLFPIVCSVLCLAYLRTIAINSERR